MALTKISTGGVKDDAASQAKIADEAVDEARLQVSNAGSNGEFLQKQSGNTGGLTWAAANQYAHPNHSGEVTSTADGAQVIADDVVDEANLKVSNSPTNGYYLQAQSGAAGGLTWAAVSQYTTPLTTRGDILFRDASGDQRLAKGTDGQYLKIGANDPVWADVVGAVADGCIFENDQTISNNHTIAAGQGAHSVGPITVSATVTINGRWVIS